MRQRQARRGSIFAYLVDLPTYRPTYYCRKGFRDLPIGTYQPPLGRSIGWIGRRPNPSDSNG